MSRIDEALRRAAGTRPATDERHQAAVAESATVAVDAPILERYAVERTPLQPEVVQHRAGQAARAPQAETPRRTAPRDWPASFNAVLNARVVVGERIDPVALEQYRRLGAVLLDARSERGLKSLMVSSALPQEGKTLTVVNLALTLSEAYHQRVLLIDADLRRPSIHEVFGIPNGEGLVDVVRSAGKSSPHVDLAPCLSVLTAGRPSVSPLAMLSSDRIHAFIEDAAKRFDWILLDTPPLGILPDAKLVARLSEAVLFVIAAGSTPYQLVKHSITELGADRVIGTVLNRVEPGALGGHSHKGYLPYGPR